MDHPRNKAGRVAETHNDVGFGHLKTAYSPVSFFTSSKCSFK